MLKFKQGIKLVNCFLFLLIFSNNQTENNLWEGVYGICKCDSYVPSWSQICAFQDNEPTLKQRTKSSDAQEMRNFYKNYYKEYIQALQNAADKADR